MTFSYILKIFFWLTNKKSESVLWYVSLDKWSNCIYKHICKYIHMYIFIHTCIKYIFKFIYLYIPFVHVQLRCETDGEVLYKIM